MTDDVELVMMNSALGPINATSESGKSLRGICAVSCGEDETCCGDYCFPGINVCCPIRNYACKPGYTCCGFFCCKSALAYCCSPNNCCAYETPHNSPTTFFPTQPPYQPHPYPTYGPVSYDSGSRPSYYSSYTPPSQPSLSLGEIIGITFGSIICLLIVGLMIGLIIIAFVTYKRRRLEYDTAAIALTVLQYQQREVTKVAPTREFIQEMPVMNTSTVPTRPKPLPRAYAPVTASAVVVSSAPDTTSNRESGVYKLINICEIK